MNILFIHQNFPGQFKFLAPTLVQQGHQVSAMLMSKTTQSSWQGVQLIPYQRTRNTTPNMHPWVTDIETKTIRGEACFRAAMKLKAAGYTPDLVIAHPGWGESLFIKEVWPNTKLGIYCEFFYHSQGADVGFDPEFPARDVGDVCRLRLKNVNNLLHFAIADAGLAPTAWQASTFPDPFRSKISVIHDGIDTDLLQPYEDVSLTLNGKHTLTRADEVVTFVNRNLEPYRGYHSFMRSLPRLLKARPHAHVLIVGGDDVSYGAAPTEGRKWKDIFAAEVRPTISDGDWARVHFLGPLPYQQFVSLLQLSTVHVYLTYPFVLSWSLLEAMSVGCAIVASDTAPVREAIRHGDNGHLVNFFDADALAVEIATLLSNRTQRQRLGTRAREFAIENYDLRSCCLPRQLAWVDALGRGS